MSTRREENTAQVARTLRKQIAYLYVGSQARSLICCQTVPACKQVFLTRSLHGAQCLLAYTCVRHLAVYAAAGVGAGG